ncbi:hypothetical protein CC1G_02293 [Coprinopsis cinerea okayama7|uniref:Rpr2-domain-containing protein n=1 Tax=Coprinopsis cinerea (strain Okayama-7 / 130 / ATCC MYA-4618 / FGSC 9003) TaxID=240176 RepID=A8N7N6_COPC7|nr:hypothetical protein CC1G_02293 [Coprinopsis cinerea okayama7\|eukprot:XP_001830842.1 hypothetical protein CC1G_02293 [Coprinopsis cinerea okayama7\
MGKNDKKEREVGPNINNVPNRDVLQRLNFMYQASAYLQRCGLEGLEETSQQSSTSNSKAEDVQSAQPGLGQEPGGSKCTNKKRKKSKSRKSTSEILDDLGQFYARSIPTVAQRTTLKIDPSVKRTLCKGCKTTLIPGVSVATRLRKLSSHGHAMVYRCLNCKTTKRIPAPRIPDGSPSLETESEKSVTRKPARLPPLSEQRDAGHVLFCGTEKIEHPEEETTA